MSNNTDTKPKGRKSPPVDVSSSFLDVSFSCADDTAQWAMPLVQTASSLAVDGCVAVPPSLQPVHTVLHVVIKLRTCKSGLIRHQTCTNQQVAKCEFHSQHRWLSADSIANMPITATSEQLSLTNINLYRNLQNSFKHINKNVIVTMTYHHSTIKIRLFVKNEATYTVSGIRFERQKVDEKANLHENWSIQTLF